MRLAGKRAVVTGAASGIGRATAMRFAQDGARVVLADIDGAVGESVAAEFRADGWDVTFLEADVTDAGHVETLVAAADDWLDGIDARPAARTSCSNGIPPAGWASRKTWRHWPCIWPRMRRVS